MEYISSDEENIDTCEMFVSSTNNEKISHTNESTSILKQNIEKVILFFKLVYNIQIQFNLIFFSFIFASIPHEWSVIRILSLYPSLSLTFAIFLSSTPCDIFILYMNNFFNKPHLLLWPTSSLTSFFYYFNHLLNNLIKYL